MKRKTKRILLVTGIFAGSVAVMMALMSMRPEQPKREVEKLDPLVDVLELQISTENFEINSQGTVRARTQTVLSAEVSGAIVEISPKFIAGGIFAQQLNSIDPMLFREAFENKGRHSALMRTIPTAVITHQQPGLLGAAIAARAQTGSPSTSGKY